MIPRALRVTVPLLLAIAACGGHAAPEVDAKYALPPEPAGAPSNALSAGEVRQGWQLLFNGTNTDGWRGWRMDSMPAGWQVAGGTLTHAAPATDIITAGSFRNFDLKVDWKTTQEGHGGIYYRADEKSATIAESAPELEVLSDSLQGDKGSPYNGAAAVTGLYSTRSAPLEPSGRWNHAEIIVKGRHVEQWLNGAKVLEYVLESPNWVDRVRRSGFARWPAYGRSLTGPIGLAGIGTGVEYANVKIRVLP
ncbi:MAG: 3-keto-disaccharide hydrolase [Gemmatimonadales bacterium]